MMQVLGWEYPTIDRIRLKSQDLSILPQVFENKITELKNSFAESVPVFWFNLYKEV